MRTPTPRPFIRAGPSVAAPMTAVTTAPATSAGDIAREGCFHEVSAFSSLVGV
ncbi:hypothetical protein [Actinomadura madurae]|uniref:hypothetical protein n=1 Tax=Actinomadura madurae TaxID=1993 RepID=UPI0020D258F4|nr:hypothetical protein [Actinomadura madurae]MCP9969216.1 hypothetical protein [Actinomadura madurae]MCQ0006793.1 hypothetical protein [Actinomadura madurae]